MGMYEGRITHVFVDRKSSFEDSITQARKLILKYCLEKYNKETQQYILEELEKDGIINIESPEEK